MSENFLFQAFSASAILAAVIMVTRKNPVTAVIFLVVVFFSVSGMFLMLDAHYVAAINVILYGGAIMVLFLFVIMLLNLGEEKAQEHLRYLQRGLSLFLVIVFFLGVSLILLSDSTVLHQSHETFSAGGVKVLGEALFTKYLLPFEVASLLLLVALIGTVYLAKQKI